MQSNTCIVSVAFRTPYTLHMKKLREFMRDDNNGAHILFYEDELPTKDTIVKENIVSTFQQSLYGFKPHAIQRAIDLGYTKIVWLDPSVLPTVSMCVLFDALDKHPMIVRKGDTPILNMCNQRAKDWFKLTDEELQGVNHIGGTVYGFNFNDLKTRDVFNDWKYAEQNGIFGNQDDFMRGHWADEACMVLSMKKWGMDQYWEESFTYYNMKNGI